MSDLRFAVRMFAKSSPGEHCSSALANNDVSLALAGGLDVQVALGTRFGIITRTLARYVWNSNATDADPFKGSFGPFSLSPGVALQIRL
jgi:hypothetical protein